jgi:outer membrane protein OmpA-like peptidoglycan-associated protein
MQSPLPLVMVVMAVSWPAPLVAAPPEVVPEGATFPVLGLFEVATPLSGTPDTNPLASVPKGAVFPVSDIIGFPTVTMPEAPSSSIANEGDELLRWVVGSDVLFDFDKAEIRADAESELEAFLDKLMKLDGFRLTVEGHTDSKGTNAYNQGLSRQRATAVAAWLASTAPTLLVPDILAFGETRPAAPNEKADGSDDPAGRRLNRRVEIVVRAPTTVR